ncbi:Phage major capsid protein E [compost metagenome]
MASYHEILEIPTLVQVVEAFPKDSYYLTNTYAREGDTFTTDEVEIQTKKGHRPLAPYVNELLPGKVVLRTGFTSKTYRPALLKPMRIITRHDLKVKQVGETLINPKTPEQRYQELIVRDLSDITDTIDRRKVQQLSEIMFTGKTEQIGEGVSQILDWGFTNIEVLSGTDLFSNDTTDVISYLTEKVQEVMEKSGRTVRRVLTTAQVGRRIVNHPTVLDKIKNGKENLDMGDLNQRILPEGVIYHGYLRQANLEIWSYTNSYTDEAGNEVNYIPAGTLALLPDGQPFEFLYGANLVANENGDFVFAEAKIYPQVLSEVEPPSRKLQLLSRPICVPDNVDGWYVAKVL